MKLKTVILTSLLALQATASFASNFNGFVGLAGGSNFFTENRTATDVSQRVKSSKSSDLANDSTGFAGDLKLGGSYRYRALNVALVADAMAQTGQAGLKYRYDYEATNLAYSDTDGVVQSKGYESMPFSFGLSLQPGLNVSDNSEIYLVSGVRLGQFKSHLPATLREGLHTVAYGTNTAYNGDFSKWLLGFDAGLGFSSYFTRHLSMEGQYDYTYYMPFTKQTQFANATGQKASSMDLVTIKYKPFVNKITLALSYHFVAQNFNKREYAHPVAWLNSIGINLPGSHPVATA